MRGHDEAPARQGRWRTGARAVCCRAPPHSQKTELSGASAGSRLHGRRASRPHPTPRTSPARGTARQAGSPAGTVHRSRRLLAVRVALGRGDAPERGLHGPERAVPRPEPGVFERPNFGGQPPAFGGSGRLAARGALRLVQGLLRGAFGGVEAECPVSRGDDRMRGSVRHAARIVRRIVSARYPSGNLTVG